MGRHRSGIGQTATRSDRITARKKHRMADAKSVGASGGKVRPAVSTTSKHAFSLISPTQNNAPAFQGRTASSAMRWSATAIFGRQAFQLIFGITLARILGPHTYGIVGEATIYVTLSTLMLDQGLSSALIQRKELSPKAPGAAVTLNLITGAVLTVVTWFTAPEMAAFFHTPKLAGLLRLLGLGLTLKSLAVTPRAMLSRNLKFKTLAVADFTGALFGAVCGVTAALLGASYHALVFQIVTSDAVIATVLLSAARGLRPNLNGRELATLLPFGLRIFATNGIAYFSRNIDNVLVGRYLGTSELAYYSMAYRVLVIPVQLLGQTVNRVLFPVFSRIASDRERVARTLLASTELLATVAIPVMTLVACSAPQFVLLGLGRQWMPTAPLISVLALAGARETIFYITPALMMAMNKAKLLVRFEIVSTGVQVAGIVIGLQVSVFGVAVGYAIAGVALTPLLMLIQRRLTGVTLGRQLGAIWPALHATAWGAASYLLISLTNLNAGIVLVLGTAAFATLFTGVLWVFHRPTAVRSLGRLLSVGPVARVRGTRSNASPREVMVVR